MRFDLLFERRHDGAQTVTVTPLDAIADGYTLSIGVRVGHETQTQVRVNGKTADSSRTPTCNPDLDELWTEAPFSGRVRAEYG